MLKKRGLAKLTKSFSLQNNIASFFVLLHAMKQVITAEELFYKIKDFLTDEEVSGIMRNKMMHDTIVLTCHEGIRNTQQAFGNLFSQVDFLCKQHHLSIADKMSIQTARRHSNSDEPLSREDLAYDGRAIAVFISAIFSKDIPDFLTPIIPHHNRPSAPHLTINRRYIRCSVNQWTEDTLTVSIDQETDTDEYLVKLYDEENHIDHRYITRLIQEGSQLNLLDCTMTHHALVSSDHQKRMQVVLPRLIIFQPDFLIDISSIATCFADYGHHPLLYLLHQMRPRANSQATILGNFAGSALDDIINSKHEYILTDTIKNNFKEKALEYCTCPHFDAAKFYKDATTQANNLKEVVDILFKGTRYFDQRDQTIVYDKDKAILEPSFVCEALGIQGRVDLMTTDMKLLVEQKSGRNMNIEHHQPNPQYHSMQLEPHYIQLLLYYGVLHYNFKLANNAIDIRLLYSKYPPADGLMVVAFYQELFREALKYRNQLVSSLMAIGREGFEKYINLFKPEILNTKGLQDYFYTKYLRPQLEEATTPLHSLSTIERSYYTRMMTFVLQEQIVAKLGYQEGQGNAIADFWNMPLSEKKDAGNIYTDLRIIDKKKSSPYNGYDTIILEIPKQGQDILPNFRIGDMIYLYAYGHKQNDIEGEPFSTPDIRKAILYKGILQEITTQQLTVHLNDGQQNEKVFVDTTYAIEHATSDSSISSQIKALHAFISADKSKRDLYLSQRAPRKNEQVQLTRSYDTILDPILLKAKQAQDYFLLVGPPGTGKTSRALQFMVKEALASGKTILLMSYTNRAVDEISEMLVDNNIDFLRIGNAYSCDKRFLPYLLEKTIEQFPKMQALQKQIQQARIIVGTTSMISSRPYIFNIKHFDLSIIDESSQILEPNIIGLITLTNKCILIGDYKQLPAVVQQREQDAEVTDPTLLEIGLTNCRNSLFERLIHWEYTNEREDFIGILQRYGRMHPEIAEFPNKKFYFHENLQPVPCAHQLEKSLNYTAKSQDTLDDILKQHRMLFIPSEFCVRPDLSDKANIDEAVIVANLLHRIYRFYEGQFDADKTVGIIVPYRNQIAMIRQEIDKLGIPELQHISIDTVERYQGSQRDVIIYSFTIQHFYQLEFLTSNCFVEDNQIIDRKLNVALTRARKQMIMTGNPRILTGNELFKELMEYCKEKGGYYNIE
ncbi:Part of AAA domain-containing protein [Segatella bryantii]|jgi:hypothetical protein|nr:Part of AAA domain-containing protein [Segatella bryantii]